MKKYIAIVIGIAGLVYAQKHIGFAKLIDDTTTADTVYIGTAQVNENTSTVLTSESRWAIKKVYTDTNGVVSVSEAYSTDTQQPKTTNKWDDRATTNVVYKAATITP